MRAVRMALIGLAVLSVTGCRHRKAPVVPVAAQAPVALEPAPEPNQPSQVASVPPQTMPVPTVKLPVKKVHHQHRKTTLTPTPTSASALQTPPAAVPAATPPVQMASVSPPPIASVIGSLTTGGDAGPERRQRASDVIDNNEKRLKALPKDTISQQRDAVARVGNFDRDATVALKEGDSEGALTLAMKAQVLLDDLEK